LFAFFGCAKTRRRETRFAGGGWELALKRLPSGRWTGEQGLGRGVPVVWQTSLAGLNGFGGSWCKETR